MALNASRRGKCMDDDYKTNSMRLKMWTLPPAEAVTIAVEQEKSHAKSAKGAKGTRNLGLCRGSP